MTGPQPMQPPMMTGPQPMQQPPMGYPSPYGQQPMPPQNGYANGSQPQQTDYMNQQPGLASPVGPNYPQNVDWEAAANAPLRRFPNWMLGVFFGGALVLAFLLLFLIGRLAR
jgi:hypothetical protein